MAAWQEMKRGEKRGYAMNLKEQTYVCVLAECGNITKAAERLFISQPALSIYISTLEKIWASACLTARESVLP